MQVTTLNRVVCLASITMTGNWTTRVFFTKKILSSLIDLILREYLNTHKKVSAWTINFVFIVFFLAKLLIDI